MTALSKSTKIAVIGAGVMGAGIAQVAAKAGHDVLLYDIADGAAERGVSHVSNDLEKLISRGKISFEEKESLICRISPVSDITELSSCGLIIEVIIENLEIKKAIFKQLEYICSKDTILATNTSSISITSIAADLQIPERVVGMHFFNPAPIMKLVEVVSGLATSKDVANRVHATAISWDKNAVFTKSTPGFIANRVARPFYAEGLRILQEGGADIATIDAAMRDSGGFKMGPFELMDLIGHDVNYAVTNSVYNSFYNDQRFLPSIIQKELIEAGRFGRKSGFGFYDYDKHAEKVFPSSATKIDAKLSDIKIKGDFIAISSLVECVKASNLTFSVEESSDVASIEIGSICLMLTDGQFASVRSKKINQSELIVFDLALDYTKSKRIVISKAGQASEQALITAVSFFQTLGKEVSIINDVPGLVVMRTIAMLANEGADAVFQRVCSIQDVDIAMKSGMNYPQGPMEWADNIGLNTIFATIKGLSQSYGEDRYRMSPLVLQAYFANLSLSQITQ